MFRSLIAQSFLLRITLVSTVCIALLVASLPGGTSEGARAQSAERAARPRPGKPEGVFPDLSEVKTDSNTTRVPAPPVPSTIRSPKSPLRPWNGRRVGDPGTQGELGQAAVEENSKIVAQASKKLAMHSRDNRTRRAHASRTAAPPTVLDDQFITNFFSYAVVRAPNGSETTYWNDQLRVAYAQGQTSLKLAAVELGKTLFESAEYAVRNRDNHWYVYDLYRTYLMRDPDAPGWAYWESEVPNNGRENVRRAFEECPEFAGILASIVPNGSATANAASLISARVDPKNQPGNSMLTRDGSWTVPLLSLPGRAGLDLGLGLSYSSMVWTRNGPYIHFDEDNGFPSPGFRLGFPVVQRKVFDAQTARNSFLFITAAGRRVHLRQVGSSNVYEAGDSSYLQLTDNSPNLLVRSTDGTQLSFVEINNEYSCTQVKDRNGNYITIGHNGLGRITTITDTLGRVITFNYDMNANLLSITQSWNGQPSHQWVGFNWGTRNMQASFSGAGVIGPKNGTTLPVITQVTLNDTSHVTFDYNNSLQVYLIRKYFGALQRTETTFTFETSGTDVPRLTDSRISAQNWTGINGVPSQVITTYSVAGDGACVMTAPDGTIYKEYYGTGWQRGLTTLSEVWSAGERKKWTTTAWTQDNTSVGYEVNPRVTETNVYDVSGNRRRTTIEYHPSFGLLSGIVEYAADPATVLRRTHFEYKNDAVYVDRRIIGLLFRHTVYDGSWNLMSKSEYNYDWESGGDMFQDTPAPATQHDRTNYGPSFVVGRGNRSQVARYDVNDPNNLNNTIVETKWRYNSTGSVLMERDHLWHQKFIAYGDAFSDSINRNTFAYPTTITDEDGFISQVQYNFDFGATTRTQGPPPVGQPQGAIKTMSFNNLGQLERITTTNNGAYTRFWYGPDYAASYATVNNVADEAYSIQFTDGLGRDIVAAGNHPGSTGGYRMVSIIYNLTGRLWKQSNPTEVNASLVPIGDDSAGFNYLEQTYDWQGRAITTADLTLSYTGCGCAGGEVVTATDPVNRQTRSYRDVLGREWKIEVLNPNGSVYTTTVNIYNARDQVLSSKQYKGPATGDGSCPTGTCQETTTTYDGHGRLASRHLPEQASGTSTVFTYRADDTLWTETDSRGATISYTYNGRHLVTAINHSAPFGIYVPAATSINYDSAGNRSSMTDGMGTANYEYDQLSRLLHERRYFTGLPNAPVPNNQYTISYGYNLAGKVTSVTDPFGYQVTYLHDNAGRISSISKPGSQGFADTMSAVHRAFDKPKQLTIGWNGNSSTVSYNYNSRMEASRFEISSIWGTHGADYSRYADGRVSFASDLSDHQFDRAYSYDHMGRVTQGLVGAEARGTTPADGPYKQTYSYDEFSNLTSRTGRHWTQNVPAQNHTFTNNRNSQWSYDADGRPTSAGSQQFKYDAAGRPVTPTGTVVETYDGDGRQVQHLSGFPLYELRSSVFGGEVLTELDPQGNKKWTFDYANGQPLGKGYWEIPTPINSGRYTIALGSVIFRDKEFSPIGDNVATENPYVGGGDPTGGYPSFGDASSFKCAWDFVHIDCASLNKFYISKNSTYVVSLIIKRAIGVRTPTTKAELVPGGDRAGDIIYGEAGENGKRSIVEVLAEPDRFSSIDTGAIMTWLQLRTVQLPFQKITVTQTVPLRNFKKLLQDTLQYRRSPEDPTCDEFLTQLLTKAGELSGGKNNPISTSMMTVYALLNRQGRGGIRLNHTGPLYLYTDWGPQLLSPVAGGAGAANGSWLSQNRTIWINLAEIPAQTTAKNLAQVPFRYALTAIHELFHVAGTSSVYSHEIMDQSARAFGAKDFDDAVRQYCIPPEMW